jgi:hypothetical protein
MVNLGGTRAARLAGTNILRQQKLGAGGLVFTIIFSTIFIATGTIVILMQQVSSDWIRTTGTIVSYESRLDSEGDTVYTPIYEYTVDGQSYKVSPSISSSFSPTVGNTHEIGYNPVDPSDAKVTPDLSTWIFLIFPVVGLAFLITGITAYVRQNRARGQTVDNLVATSHSVQADPFTSVANPSNIISAPVLGVNKSPSDFTKDLDNMRKRGK